MGQKTRMRVRWLIRGCAPGCVARVFHGAGLWSLAAAVCFTAVPLQASGGAQLSESRGADGSAFHANAGAISRPVREDLRWLDLHHYTADELLLFQEMPIVISVRWLPPQRRRSPCGETWRQGNGLALSEDSAGGGAPNTAARTRRGGFDPVTYGVSAGRSAGGRPGAPRA